MEQQQSAAQTEVSQRFADRLVKLARTRLDDRLRKTTDPEDVMQSVWRRFFTRRHDGQRMLTKGDAGWPCIWDVSDASPKTHRLQDESVTHSDALALSPNGQFLAWAAQGMSGSRILLWDLAGDVSKIRQRMESAGVLGLRVFSPDNTMLAIYNKSATHTELWSLSGDQPSRRTVLKGSAQHVVFSADGLSLIAAYDSPPYGVNVWNLAQPSSK